MTTEKRVRVLMADDVLEWRIRIRSILQGQPDWQVIGEASNGLEAVQMAAEYYPDIVLLDLGMPILNGIEAANRIRQESPRSKIIFVTQESDADIRIAALATGAEGYLLKANVWNELLPSVEAAMRNGHEARALFRD